MKNPRDNSKQPSYWIIVLVTAILLSLAVWNYVEIRGLGNAVRELVHWNKVDKKEAAQLEEIESWDGQFRAAYKEESEERRSFRSLYQACRCKSDLFAVHPGEIHSKSFGRPSRPARKHWFYLPPGEHRLHVSISKVTREGGVFTVVSRENYDNPSDGCVTEKLAEHDYELKGGQVHEIEFHRESSEEGCTFTGSVNGEVMAETVVGPAKHGYRIHNTSGTGNSVIPHEIRAVQALGSSGEGGLEKAIQTAEFEQNSEFEYMLRDKIWYPRLIPDYMLRFDNTAGDGVHVHYRFQLEVAGGPRANIVDQMFSTTMMNLLKKSPFDFDRHFEYKDGLYFLKPDAPSDLPATSGGEPTAHDRF